MGNVKLEKGLPIHGIVMCCELYSWVNVVWSRECLTRCCLFFQQNLVRWTPFREMGGGFRGSSVLSHRKSQREFFPVEDQSGDLHWWQRGGRTLVDHLALMALIKFCLEQNWLWLQRVCNEGQASCLEKTSY